MLTPYADKAKADGIKVYHLNIGAPDIKSPKEVPEALVNFKFDHLPYSNSAGDYDLRAALVEKYYRRLGIDISTDDLLVTEAGSEALSMMFKAICNPGDEVIVFEPFYCNYNTLAEMDRVKLVAVHTDIRNGFRLPSEDEITAAITPRTKAILIGNPSNPTGTLYSREDILAIGRICKSHDLFFVSDEVYREFCYTEEPHFSVMQVPGLEENAILLDSASKRYNLCGARIGCFISRNRAIIELVTKFAQARLCPSVPGQVLLSGALGAGKQYFESVRREYIARRDFTLEALNNIPGVFSPVPQGAFYTIAELPVEDATVFAKWLITDFRPHGETVMITPAQAFYMTPGAGRNQIRIAYVLQIPELGRAMEILAEGLEEFKKIQQ